MGDGMKQTSRIVWPIAALAAILLTACQGEERDLSREYERQMAIDAVRERVVLDSSACPAGGEGHVYVALGDVVVRVPLTTEPVSRSPLYSNEELLPAPPVPSAPEGCREHPARAQGLHLVRYQDFFFTKADRFPGLPLVEISVGWMTNGRSHLQEINENFFNRSITKAECREVADGLTGCGDGGPDTAEISAYRASTLVYSSPDGRPFVVVCGLGPSVFADDCEVSYRLRDGLALNYRFFKRQVPGGRMPVPIEQVIELDRAIRDGVSSMIVDGYRMGAA